MAVYKLSKAKTFHVDYCGCTAAALLLNDQTIRSAIDLILQVKTKRDFVKTTVTIAKDGIKITYNNEQKFSTVVPSSMIAASAIGKSTLHAMIGVVYISPLTGQHFPAFVHVYRCDTGRSAQKLLSRLQSYLLIENHRLQMVQLEQQLLQRNLLNTEHFNAIKSHKTSTGVSSSSRSTDSRQENAPGDPIKSITDEFHQKIKSNQPLLFPPKDYDTVHAAHGNVHRAQAWKSTEPTIVGFAPIESDDSRGRRHPQTSFSSAINERKNSGLLEENDERSRITSPRRDSIVDPVETVSLAFDFLKDETSSIFTDHDGNIEYLDVQQQNKTPLYRFRPPQVTAVTKKIFPRKNNYDLTNDVSPSNPSSRNDLNAYYNNSHQQYTQNGHRARSETRLHYEQQSTAYLGPQYESRLVTRSGVPISTNPLWTAPSPNMAGSQPNLLSRQSRIDSTSFGHRPNPPTDRQTPSDPLQHPLYSSYPDTKTRLAKQQQQQHPENQPKRSTTTQHQYNKKQITQSQYLDTDEFILRASNGQPLRHAQHPNRHASREYRPHSMHSNGAMVDVYY